MRITLYSMNLPYSILLAFFLAGSFTACTGLTWTSASVLANNSVVRGCLRDDLILPWAFAKEPDEQVTGVQWYLHRAGRPHQLVAIYVTTLFFKMPAFTSHLEFHPNAGIRLVSISQAMFGTYGVQVNYTHRGSAFKSVQRVQIARPDPPVTKGRNLVARLLPLAELNNSTDDWHVHIACGDFVDAGRPPVSVTWTTSSRRQMNSTSYRQHTGQFVLRLPNPVAEGDYSCRLHLPRPTRKCGHSVPRLLYPATVHVDGVGANLAITTAKLEVLEQENTRLRNGIPSPVCPRPVRRPENCVEVQNYFPASGLHDIYLRNSRTMRVYCNQTIDGGGWTVIQRRVDGSVSFDRNWNTYEKGFGDLHGNFWFGLSNMHHLTSSRNYSLRVDLTDWDGRTGYALYDTFYIDGASDDYRLHVAGYSGTIDDMLNWFPSKQNNRQFSTKDRDPYRWKRRGLCLIHEKSGWWFNQCSGVNLNGVYGSYFIWGNWNIKLADMKIRPRKL